MRMLGPGTVLLTLLVAIQPAGPIHAADYLREIKPLLTARCYACHGALQHKAGLRLDTAQFIREGGESGPAIVAGKSGESLLIAHVTGAKDLRRMPPPNEGEQLKDNEIALLRTWIDQGAVGPADEKPEPDPREHWAFRAPVRPSIPPPTSTARLNNPVDAFIAAQYQKHGLAPQRPADRRVLLRRVYLDLIGLPPTRAEQEAFLADTAPDAYERVVDRLLASPQYGERWGRHWMDIWRYSDWWGLGAEVRNSQKHIWHWRDWIIESQNRDEGYDEMLQQMIAADELYPNDLDRLRASGFLARQYFKFNRTTWLDGLLEHGSKAFLSLTINCAKCHDHKYDPISHQDYYRLRAFFEPYQLRTEQVPGEPDFEKNGIPRAFDCNLDAPTYRHIRGDERQPQKDRPLAPGLPPLLAIGELKIEPVTLPPEAHSPGLRLFVLQDQLRAADRQLATARDALQQARKVLADAEKNQDKAAAPAIPKSMPTPWNAALKPSLKEDFAGPRPEVWEIGPGEWKHAGGKLTQNVEGEMRSAIRLKGPASKNFQARFKFAITGGMPWRSVGLCFDTTDSHEILVYASAFQGGSKVQIAYKQGGAHTYPQEAMQSRTIPLNTPIELTLRVRDALVNVAVNGEQSLAYRLPIPRREGRIELITFAAKAEFHAFELSALPDDFVLTDPRSAPAVSPAQLTLEQARAGVEVAEKALAAAELQPAALRARHAADVARSQKPPADNAAKLAEEAAKAERQAVLARSEEDLARAELELLKADAGKKSAAEQKRNTARDAVARARKAIEAPGNKFTPLKGALKTLESNVESEESRARPFPTTSTGRRTALARWLADPRNPLTARVAVNHIWARHFGRPLVPTVFDFGRKGTPPTHPELLDYLAVEFMESGWSQKHVHRLLVTSETYRLSSSAAGADASSARDPENRYYWRMNPLRMEAQAIRDSLLHLAGELDPQMGGPSVPVNDEASRRRGLYFVHSHNDHQRFLSMFDDANVLECYRRAESIVPQQALALSNSKLALSLAEKINARLHAQLGTVSDGEFARVAFETILGSTPTPAELKACEQALAELRGLLGKQADADRRARGNLVTALLNHNDFITIR